MTWSLISHNERKECRTSEWNGSLNVETRADPVTFWKLFVFGSVFDISLLNCTRGGNKAIFSKWWKNNNFEHGILDTAKSGISMWRWAKIFSGMNDYKISAKLTLTWDFNDSTPIMRGMFLERSNKVYRSRWVKK